MTIPQLPLRELPLPGESLTGYLRRHVTAMGYQGLRQLLGLIEGVAFPAHLDHLADDVALTALAHFLRRDRDVLQAMTGHRWAEALTFRRLQAALPRECDSKTLLKYFQTARNRVCFHCLADAPEHDRLIWSFRPLNVCIEHGSFLFNRCSGCRRRFSPLRLDLVRCCCGRRLEVDEDVIVDDAVRNIAEQTVRWLDGESCSPFDLPPHAAFWWVDRLRAAVIRTPNWLARLQAEWNLPEDFDNDSIAWSAAVELTQRGPPRLAEFLDVYQTIDKHQFPSTGAGRAFGTLLHDADRLERMGFPVPASVLRDYLTSHYNRGHLSGKVILFRSAIHRHQLTSRPWITQTAAARRLGTRPPTVAELVRRGALVGRIESTGLKGRTVGVVRRDSVEALRDELTQTLSTVEAGEILGVDRHRILDLIHAEVFRSALRTSGGWRLSRRCIDEILDRLASLPRQSADEAGSISLPKTVRHYGASDLTLARCVKWILAGQLPAYRSTERPTFRHVVLLLIDVRRAAAESRDAHELEHGYPLIRLARLLVPNRPLKETVLRKWIRAGLLHARRRRKAWCVAPTEVERFRKTYCLADEACELLGITRTTLSRWETERRIAPIYGRATHASAGASVFLRADVRRLAIEPAA